MRYRYLIIFSYNPFMNIDQILQAVVIGMVQGLTEFIPVSSSAHVTLTPILFNWDQPDTTFLLMVHVGTLIALLAYFRRKIWNYIKVAFRWLKAKGKLTDKDDKDDFRVMMYVALAAIPAGVIGLLMEDTISGFYDNPNNQEVVILTILIAMAVVGVVFLFSERLFSGKKPPTEKLHPFRVFVIGIAQAIAFFRGVSRSGATLIAGQLMGLNKVNAAEFSFLISIPILVATSAIGIMDLASASADQIKFALVGMVSAAISGYFAIRFMLNYLKHKGLQAFGWYRIIFAVLMLIILFYT
jgi:undecaprenyl-diphosphatase